MDSQGNLYGTTYSGGNTSNCPVTTGCGTVFELVYGSGAYSEQILYTFSPTSTQHGLSVGDSALPEGGLVMDSQGNLYGTTFTGGANGYGTVFELVNNSGTWSEQILYSFDGTDGSEPRGGLIMDGSGNLYGTTAIGGANGHGAVFEMVKNSGAWSEQTLYAFSGGTDGDEPAAALTMDSNGVLFGTTYYGGGGSCFSGILARGCGTVFELVNNSGAWSEQILYRFDGPHGQFPLGGLIVDPQGNLWGTTSGGGSGTSGTVFELVPNSGTYLLNIVYDFATSGDGSNPEAGLLMDSQGNLYGTTADGGSATNSQGTIFELVQSSGYTYKLLHEFASGGVGATNPFAPLVQNASGVMFGTTYSGGTDNVGTVYQLAVAPVRTVATSTSLTYAPNPPVAGATVQFTALVTAPSLPGLVVDGGFVTFYSGTTLLGTLPVSSSVASLPVDAETQEIIGDGTVTAQYAPGSFKGGISDSIFTGSSGEISVDLAEPGVATTTGSNTFNGSQTVNGTVYATGFTGNGAGLTNVTAVGLNCLGCVGNSQLGISYAGSASQGGPATSALTAATALDALSFGGEPLAAFPTLAAANTFTAAQSMPDLTVTGSAHTGPITIGGGTAVAELVSTTFALLLPAIDREHCATQTTGAVAGFTPGTSDTIALGIPGSMLSMGASGVFLMYEAWETSASPSPTITIQVCNVSKTKYRGGNSGAIRVDIVKH